MPIPVQQFQAAPSGLGQALAKLLQGGAAGYGQGFKMQQANKQTQLKEAMQRAMEEKMRQPPKPTSLMQNVSATGVDISTPDGQKRMLEALMKPSTQVNIGKLSPTDAGKAGFYEEGIKNASVVKDFFLDNKGEPDFKNIALSTDWPLVGVLPKSPGGKAHNAMEGVIQAFLRAETGAAATPAELKNIKTRYMPSLTDSASLVKQKINNLINRLHSTKQMYDPESKYGENVPRETQPTQQGQTVSYGGRDYTREELQRIMAGGQ